MLIVLAVFEDMRWLAFAMAEKSFANAPVKWP